MSKNTSQGNRAGRSAVVHYKSAALSTEFGMKMLRAKFPDIADEILKELGNFSRGPRKGLPRGYVHWSKVVEGGWDYRFGKGGGVLRPGTIEWYVAPTAETIPDNAPTVDGMFHKKATQEYIQTCNQAAQEAPLAPSKEDFLALPKRERHIAQARMARHAAHIFLRNGNIKEFKGMISTAIGFIMRARNA